jgi:hypothetical protein
VLMSLKKFSLALAFLMVAAVAPAFAQGTLHKQVWFKIDAPFELGKTGVILPPGKYILYQIDAISAPTVFALYREDMRRAPIAMLSTVRIEYAARGYPGKTRILLGTDEVTSPQAYPMLEGWNIPGEDGWEMIGAVVSSREAISGYQARSNNRARSRQNY